MFKALHLEITNRCNASCPMCARNILGAATDPGLVLSELSMEDITRIFTPSFCEQLDTVLVCGTHGDPIVSQTTLPAIAHMKKLGVNSVEVYTNGSAQNEEWWTELGQILKDKGDRVAFSVDGLEDTNHLYRKGTSWEKIMKNMKSYLSAGGVARWDFLVFKHNEHQVETAQKMAVEMGFKDFRIRKTSRFSAPLRRETSRKFPVLKKMNTSEIKDFLNSDNMKDGLNGIDPKYIDYYLAEPENDNLKNKDTSVRLKKVFDEHQDFNTYLNETPLTCIYKESSRFYISATAKVWPCSYVAGDSIARWGPYKVDIREKVIDKYGVDFNNLRVHSLDEVLEHPWFVSELDDSFKNTLDDDANPRLLKCARTCGKGYNPILSQTESVKFKK